MVDREVEIRASFDPFAEAQEYGGRGVKELVHIWIRQRNRKKSLTIVQGLKEDWNFDKIVKGLKKELCCNGNVTQDKEFGKVIQLQGDQRKNVALFLVKASLLDKTCIKIHGF